MDLCSTVDTVQLPRLQRHSCLTMRFTRGCRGIPALVPRAPPALPSPMTLVPARLLLSHSLTPLSLCNGAGYLLLLNSVIPEALPLSLLGSALASGGSVLEPAGIGSLRHGESFWQILTKETPVAPPAAKTLPCKPNSRCSHYLLGKVLLSLALCWCTVWEVYYLAQD